MRNFIVLLLFGLCCAAEAQIIINHHHTDIYAIPQEWIEQAKEDLHIVYGHTSHGGQITTGMSGLEGFMEDKGYPDLYRWTRSPQAGALHMHDDGISGDLGEYGDTSWADRTREYLDDPANAATNVVMWSWCGGVSTNTTAGINAYLNAMNQLETEYPGVRFVYMTGHLDIWNNNKLKANNQQIRDYCIANGKILYDFADIESYDPDGVRYLYANDTCDYYRYASGAWIHMGNWAQEWQDSHEEGVDWYDCESAHSEPLNANRKAYAAWWLWARLAGWEGTGGEGEGEGEITVPPLDDIPTGGCHGGPSTHGDAGGSLVLLVVLAAGLGSWGMQSAEKR